MINKYRYVFALGSADLSFFPIAPSPWQGDLNIQNPSTPDHDLQVMLEDWKGRTWKGLMSWSKNVGSWKWEDQSAKSHNENN
jgi:hypothetical protein